MNKTGFLALAGYVLTIPAANYAIGHIGWPACAAPPCMIPVGPDLWAPSGVLFAGLAFTLRDAVQERLGREYTLIAITLGTVLSLALADPFVALASAVAFAVSELSDWLVYEPIRRRNLLAAVAASNTVGLIADSILFLALAFGSLDFLPGQVVGKLEVTIVTVAVLWFVRRRRGAVLPRHASAELAGAD